MDYTDTDTDLRIPETPTQLDANTALQVLARYFAQQHESDRAVTVGIQPIIAAVPVDEITSADELEMEIYTVTEPPSHVPQVDADGFVWIHRDEDDEDGPGWQRQRMEAGGDAKYLLGPPMSDEWEDVLWYGPMRSVEDDDTYLGIVVEYFPDGYDNGRPQGDSIRYTPGEFAAFLAGRRTSEA